MGLLGTSFDDPKTSGILALAGNMVRGDFGGGLLGFNQAYQGAQDSQLKRQLMTEDISLKRLAEQRAQALFDMQRDAYAGVGGGGGGAPQPAIPPSPGGPLGSGTYGIPSGGQPGGGQAAPQGLVSAQLNRLERMAIAGVPGAKEALDIFKYKNDPQTVKAGDYSRNPLTGALTYNPDPTKGIAIDGQGAITRMPGSENIAALAGEAATATEGAKDQFAPPTMVNTPQGPRLMTPAQARLYATGGQPRPMAAPANFPPQALTQPGDADRTRILQAEAVAAQQRLAQLQADPRATPDLLRRAQDDVTGLAKEMQRSNISGASLPGGALKTAAQDATDAANKKFLEGRAGEANNYEASLNGRVAQGTELNMRLQEQLGALDKFRAGGGGETRAQLAQIAQAIPGMPKSVVNGVAGGDLSAMQEFNKLAAQTAMEQLKQSMGGAGRISQYEFKVFQNNNPNLSTDPDAIRKIFDFNNKLYRRDLSEQQAFNQHIQSGANPSDFPAQWAQTLAKNGTTAPNMDTQRAQPLPANPNPRSLSKGAAYTLPDGRVGVWDGMGFKVK
jgi:hypothetical protein